MPKFKNFENDADQKDNREVWVMVEALNKLSIGTCKADDTSTVVLITGKDDGEVIPLVPADEVVDFIGEDKEAQKDAFAVGIYIAANFVSQLDRLGVIKWQE